MTTVTHATLDIAAQWGRLNDTIIGLVDYIPDDKLDWSPQEDLWNFRGILLHTIMTRDGWLGSGIGDGGPTLDEPGAVGSFVRRVQSKEEIKKELRRSWQRLQSFLAEPDRLSSEYQTPGGEPVNGHWIAFHLLEHDVHHRSDIFHYLAALEIEHPEVETP